MLKSIIKFILKVKLLNRYLSKKSVFLYVLELFVHNIGALTIGYGYILFSN